MMICISVRSALLPEPPGRADGRCLGNQKDPGRRMVQSVGLQAATIS